MRDAVWRELARWCFFEGAIAFVREARFSVDNIEFVGDRQNGPDKRRLVLKRVVFKARSALSLRKVWYGLERRDAAQQDEQLG